MVDLMWLIFSMLLETSFDPPETWEERYREERMVETIFKPLLFLVENPLAIVLISW